MCFLSVKVETNDLQSLGLNEARKMQEDEGLPSWSFSQLSQAHLCQQALKLSGQGQSFANRPV